MLIDTHAHVNFNAYREDSDEVIRRALDNGVWMINVGSQYSTSQRAVRMAEKYPEGVYAAIGLHPIHLETGLVKIKEDKEEIEFKTIEEDFDYEKYKSLASSSKKVVAIGEIGLDYYWKPKTKTRLQSFKEKQAAVLLRQLDLAKELNLPVMFHCRSAHNELSDILDSGVRGVIHCFTGTWEQAEKYLKMGFYLGFDGIIFKLNLDEVIKKTPLERILAETDCPYLMPLPVGGRNEPLNIRYIVQRIAEIKGVDYDAIADTTTQNAKKLFKID
jgi:TatD DNase family protein